MGIIEEVAMLNGAVAVTGADGFIGGALVQRLLGKTGLTEAEVVSYDLHYDEDDRCARTTPGVPYGQPGKLLEALDAGAKPRVIYHLGAISETTCIDKALLRYWNTDYTNRLIDRCLEKDIRLIYASSAATYSYPPNPDAESEWDAAHYNFSDDFNLLSVLRPKSLYAQSKHASDLHYLQQGFAPNVTSVKFFNVYGNFAQERKKKQPSVVAQWTWQIELGSTEPFLIWTVPFKAGDPNGDQIVPARDFIWIEDVLDVLEWLEHQAMPAILNVGTGERVSFRLVADALYYSDLLPAASRGPAPASLYKLQPLPEDMRANYQAFTKADITKLRTWGYDKAFRTIGQALLDPGFANCGLR